MVFDKNGNFTKTEMSPELKCPENLNVTKTEIPPKLKRLPNLKVH